MSPQNNPAVILGPMRFLLAALVLLGAAPQEPAAPLFNGKDLSGFTTFLEKKGKNADPDQVFTVADGVIRVSGQEFGYFATEKEYENFRLTAEFKWGKETHAPRKVKARDSGILFHMTGEDKIWPKSVEFQIIEGGTGDVILVDGASMEYDPAFEPRLSGKRDKIFSPDGKRLVAGRVNWPKRSPQWKDALDFRGPDDLEKPLGEWNALELLCADGAFTYWVNGTKVVEGKGAEPRKGRILFQSEGAELFFRKIEVNVSATQKR